MFRLALSSFGGGESPDPRYHWTGRPCRKWNHPSLSRIKFSARDQSGLTSSLVRYKTATFFIPWLLYYVELRLRLALEQKHLTFYYFLIPDSLFLWTPLNVIVCYFVEIDDFESKNFISLGFLNKSKISFRLLVLVNFCRWENSCFLKFSLSCCRSQNFCYS